MKKQDFNEGHFTPIHVHLNAWYLHVKTGRWFSLPVIGVRHRYWTDDPNPGFEFDPVVLTRNGEIEPLQDWRADSFEGLAFVATLPGDASADVVESEVRAVMKDLQLFIAKRRITTEETPTP